MTPESDQDLADNRRPKPTLTPMIPESAFPEYAAFFGELKGGIPSQKSSLVIAHIPQRTAGGGVYFAYYQISKNEWDSFTFRVTETDQGTYKVEHGDVTMEFTADGRSLHGTFTDASSKTNYPFSLTLIGKGKDVVSKTIGDAFLLVAHGRVSGWVSPNQAIEVLKRADVKSLP